MKKFAIRGLCCPLHLETYWASLINRGSIVASMYHHLGRPREEAEEAVKTLSNRDAFAAIRDGVTFGDIDRIVDVAYKPAGDCLVVEVEVVA